MFNMELTPKQLKIRDFISQYGIANIIDECKPSDILNNIPIDYVFEHYMLEEAMCHYDDDAILDYAVEIIENEERSTLEIIYTPTLNARMELDIFMEMFIKKYY